MWVFVGDGFCFVCFSQKQTNRSPRINSICISILLAWLLQRRRCSRFLSDFIFVMIFLEVIDHLYTLFFNAESPIFCINQLNAGKGEPVLNEL